MYTLVCGGAHHFTNYTLHVSTLLIRNVHNLRICLTAIIMTHTGRHIDLFNLTARAWLLFIPILRPTTTTATSNYVSQIKRNWAMRLWFTQSHFFISWNFYYLIWFNWNWTSRAWNMLFFDSHEFWHKKWNIIFGHNHASIYQNKNRLWHTALKY